MWKGDDQLRAPRNNPHFAQMDAGGEKEPKREVNGTDWAYNLRPLSIWTVLDRTAGWGRLETDKQGRMVLDRAVVARGQQIAAHTHTMVVLNAIDAPGMTANG